MASQFCKYCDHRQLEHKQSRGGCRELGCNCARFEPRPAVPPLAEVEPVDLAKVAEQADAMLAQMLPQDAIEHPAAAWRRMEQEIAEGRTALADGEEGRKVLTQQRDMARAEVASARQEREQADAAGKLVIEALQTAEADLETARKERDEARSQTRGLAAELREAHDQRDKARDLVVRMAAAAHLDGDGDPVVGIEMLHGFWREADARNRELAAKLGDAARPDQSVYLARYDRWFCQPLTGCGHVAHAPDDTHECGPLIRATVTITHEGAPTV